MTIKNAVFFLSFVLFCSGTQAGSSLQFSDYRGYLALPAPQVGSDHSAASRYPGIILLHDWWGLDDQVKLEAERLAEKKFVVLAVDFYGGKSTKSPSEANRWKEHLSGSNENKIVEAALLELQKNPKVNKSHIGIVGYGMGADIGVRNAINGSAIQSLVLLYANPPLLPQDLKKIRCPVFALFGDSDKTIASRIGLEFESALKEAHVEHLVKTYENSKRGFADSLHYDSFNPVTGPLAQKDILEFLQKYLLFRY